MKYEDYLKHKDSEWTTKWENVQELITFASEARLDEVNWGAVGEDGARPANEDAEEKYAFPFVC